MRGAYSSCGTAKQVRLHQTQECAWPSGTHSILNNIILAFLSSVKGDKAEATAQESFKSYAQESSLLFVLVGLATRAGLVPLAQADAGTGDRGALGWTALLPAAAAVLLAASWPGRASCDAEVCRALHWQERWTAVSRHILLIRWEYILEEGTHLSERCCYLVCSLCHAGPRRCIDGCEGSYF